MSNRRTANGNLYSLDKYRKDATGKPFVLQVSDEQVIEIPRPTGDVIMDVEEISMAGAAGSRQILTLLCGEKADEFLDVIGKEDFTVLEAVAKDMREHFGLPSEPGE